MSDLDDGLTPYMSVEQPYKLTTVKSVLEVCNNDLDHLRDAVSAIVHLDLADTVIQIETKLRRVTERLVRALSVLDRVVDGD